MAQINKPSLHMNTKLYTGTGSSNALTGVGFQPDLTWIKKRNGTNYHVWTDAVRLATKQIYSNDNGAEQTVAEGLKSFDSDGFTLGTNGDTNGSGGSYVAWNWKAGTGQGSSNTDGSINTTYTSVNTTAGFSISKYTGTGANATVGHGLGVAPKMIIIKDLTESSYDWMIYHQSLGATKYIRLNLSNVVGTSSVWQDTAPTNQVFSIVSNSSDVNKSGNNFVAYCFAEKKGYSKFGSYEGNANANGTFIYTGFKPSFVLIKNTNDTANWTINDTGRDQTNANNLRLFPNQNVAENTGSDSMDMLSNGFKLRSTDSGNNGNGNVMIYMAFAENPIVGSNNIPAVAR
tara:strand:+ start:2237 stop:3271 length:1035 start_codon:yes stop_codon:yes gene_type:complete